MEEGEQKPAKPFRDLRVWQSAYELAVGVYKSCDGLPKHEQYGLTSQMCRAAVSVCSNIAEGFGRRGVREKDQFYSIANGSLTELENQLLITKDVGYITEAEFAAIYEQCQTTHRMLAALQKINQKKGERS